MAAVAELEVAQRLQPVFLPDALYHRIRTILLAVMVGGWSLCLLGYFLSASASGESSHLPNRFFSSYLFAYTAFTVVPLGAWFFVQLQFLAGAAWSVTVRRVMETLMALVPVGALLFVPVLIGAFQGQESIYEWMHPGVVAGDALLRQKAVWFDPTFFVVRVLCYFALWSFWTLSLYRNSVAQDRNGDLKYMNRNSTLAAPGLLVAMLSVSLFAFDILMSLDPHWYSTIFGLYTYAGGAWLMMGLLTLICIGLQRAGVLRNEISTEHYHDLGKWMFALTVFWTYIGFSQYMLIAYANIPEETIFFHRRGAGAAADFNGWSPLSYFLLIGHFILPFLFLIFRASKRTKWPLIVAGFWFILVHLVDHYWLVMPTYYKSGPAWHFLDLACPLAVGSTYAFAFWMLFRRQSILCVGDPRYEQSLRFHNI